MDNTEEQIVVVDNDDTALQSPISEKMPLSACQAAFEAIRERSFAHLQELGANYIMTVKNLVQTCLASSLQIDQLAKKHALLIAEQFKSCNCTLVNHTNSNAMLSFDDLYQMIVRFDLNQHEHAILSAEFTQPHKYYDQYGIVRDKLILQRLQSLMLESINDTQIVIPYMQVKRSIRQHKQQLGQQREILYNEILHRAFTAFEFEDGLSFYTLNFSDDMSMLFWDRYTVVQSTAKSFYIDQYCIVEHIISGKVEPEKFIMQLKPSKNSMREFLAERYACLVNLIRPVPNTDDVSTEAVTHVVERQEEQTDDDGWTVDELLEQGINPLTVDASNIVDYDAIVTEYGSIDAYLISRNATQFAKPDVEF